jgi:hypothetical protein
MAFVGEATVIVAIFPRISARTHIIEETPNEGLEG